MMEGYNPMEQAMRNPIVLEQILQNRFIEAKKMRLVCKQWNEIILTLPEPKLHLNLNSDKLSCCESHAFQIYCSDMEPRLARSIAVSQKCTRSWGNPRSAIVQAVGAMLIHLCDKYGHLIQFLDLHLDEGLIYKILQKITYCPNLEGLIVRKYDVEVDADAAVLSPGEALLPVPSRPKLVSIYLHVGQSGATDIRHSLGQRLINSAPNLEKLELGSEEYFPDLSGSTKLRVLLIPGGLALQKFQFEEFSQMLKQIAEKLEVLRIGCPDSIIDYSKYQYNWDADGVDANRFQMPRRMPKLKTFSNECVDVFTCGDALQDLSSWRCPSLRSLYLSNTSWFNSLDPLLLRVIENKTRLNVTSLTLESVNNGHSYLLKMKTCFPDLESLKLLNMSYGINEEDAIELGPVLKACASLGLSHLELDNKMYPFTLSEFSSIVSDNSSFFKTLKTLRVHPPRCANVSWFDKDILKETPEGLYQMQQFLLTLVGMKSVVIFPAVKKDAWWESIHQFIQKNNIIIEFEWWSPFIPSSKPLITL